MISSLTQTENSEYNNEYNNNDTQWPFYIEPINNSIIPETKSSSFCNNLTNLSSGYAKNPFIPMWPNEIATELKEKLSFPNYGLRSTISSSSCSNLDYSDYL